MKPLRTSRVPWIRFFAGTFGLWAFFLLFGGLSAATPPQETAHPAPRSGYSLAYDSLRDRVVMFGGSAAFGQEPSRLGDTWEFDGERWADVAVPGPPARSDGQMTFDSARGVVVLFGGMTADGRGSDTWEFDGTVWRQVATSGPPARNLAAMAFDSRRQRVILFGGGGADRRRFGDTWEWDGVNWIEADSGGSGSPSGRGAHALAFDPASGRTLLFGGWDGEATRGDLWAWDGRAWDLLQDDGPPRLHAAVDFDPELGRLVVFGGFGNEGRESTTWTWTAGAWSQPDLSDRPQERAEHEGVFAGPMGFVVFGGIVGQGMAVEDRFKTADTWRLTGEGWHPPDVVHDVQGR